MQDPANQRPPPDPPPPALRIYFLPNLMTAGSLICGFVALTKIFESGGGKAGDPVNYFDIKYALAAILLACIFDLLDSRVAAWAGWKAHSAANSVAGRCHFSLPAGPSISC